MSSTVQAQGRDPNQFAEQRIYLRKKVARPLPIELLPGKGVWLHDLGEGGLSVSGSSPLQLGTNTYLSFQFPEVNSLIEAAGVVAWSDLSGRVGVRFTRVKPDSTAALKRWLKAESAMKDISAITGESSADEPLAARVHSLDLVSELQNQVADAEDREAALDLVAQRMLQLTRASGAAIALREGADVICRASAGNAPPVGMKLTLDSTLSGECFRTGNLVLLGDSDNDPRVDPEVCRDLNFRSLLIHPIISDDQVTGILEVLSPLPGNFEGGDVLVLGFVAEMVASLDPAAVSPSSPAALGELSQFIHQPIPEEADLDLLNLSSNLADPVEEPVVETDVLDEPFFALDAVPSSNGSSPTPVEFESLPAWVHEPPKPAIADVAPYVERAIEQQEQEIDVEPLEVAAIEEPPAAPLVERAATVAPVRSPAVADTLSRPSFTAHESVARTPFRAHQPIAEPKSRVPLYVTAGVAVALLGIGGSYYGLRSRSTQRPVATIAPTPTATASAPAPANDLSTAPATVPVSSANIAHKSVKAVKPAAALPATTQPTTDEEVSVTLRRDAASNARKASESGEVPAAPSLNGFSDGGGAINSVTALAGAPTTRVEAGARPAPAASAPAPATGVTGGQLLRRVSPIYPDFARRSGITGSVVLTGTVTTDGVVKHIKVISGNAMLADAAIRAVNQWRYSPFIYNGKPIETETRIVLNFNH